MVKAQKKNGQKKKGLGLVPGIFAGLGMLAIVNWQVAVFAAIGLVPTVILAATGSGRYHSMKLQCVAFCNVVAIIPFAMELWDRPNDFNMMLAQLFPIVSAWVGAGVGYGLIFGGPFIAAIILQAFSQEKLKGLAKQRQALVDRWGADVISGPSSAGSSPKK